VGRRQKVDPGRDLCSDKVPLPYAKRPENKVRMFAGRRPGTGRERTEASLKKDKKNDVNYVELLLTVQTCLEQRTKEKQTSISDPEPPFAGSG
jgi:hypothetical protein